MAIDNITRDLGVITTLTAQGAGTINSDIQVNKFGLGIRLVINITAITAGSLTVTLQGYDPATQTYQTILASAAIATTGQTVLKVYPGTVVAANSVANDFIPERWNIKSVVATGPVTATISACAILS